MGEIVQLDARNSVLLRPMGEEDRNFVMSSWLRAFKGSYYAGPIQYDLYYQAYQTVLERILARPGVTVMVAANPAEPSQIFGYAVREEGLSMPCLHWIYVKRQVRGFGIAQALLSHLGFGRDDEFVYTFRVKNSTALASKYRTRFNPHYVCKKN